MDPDPQRLEDIGSIRDALRQISQEAQVAVDLLDAKIEDKRLDGRTEAVEVRTILELIQSLSLEVSEQLDTYQGRHARQQEFLQLTSGAPRTSGRQPIAVRRAFQYPRCLSSYGAIRYVPRRVGQRCFSCPTTLPLRALKGAVPSSMKHPGSSGA